MWDGVVPPLLGALYSRSHDVSITGAAFQHSQDPWLQIYIVHLLYDLEHVTTSLYIIVDLF